MQNKTLIIILTSFYILVNASLANATYTGNITAISSYSHLIDRGTNLTLYGILPSNGSQYNYQWLYRYESNNGSNMTAWLSANTLCSPAFGIADKNESVQCSFLTNTTTPTGTYSFGLKVVNKTLSLQTPNSSSLGIQVAPSIEKPNPPTLSNATVELGSGQPITISDTLPYGGSGNFYYQWLVSYGSNTLKPIYSLPVSNFVADVFNSCYIAPPTFFQSGGSEGQGGSSNHTISCTIPNYGSVPEPPLGEYHIALQVMDMLDPSEVVNSTPVTLTIGNGFSHSLIHALATSLEANNSVIYQGQDASFTIKLPNNFGGSPPYSYKWIMCYQSGLNSTQCNPYSTTSSEPLATVCQQPSGGVIPGEILNCTFSTNNTTPQGQYIFNLQITDNESQTVTSSEAVVLVYPKIPVAPAPYISGPILIDQYQSTTLIVSIPNYTISSSVLANQIPKGFQAFWLYSYNGSNYSSTRLGSAPSLCNFNASSESGFSGYLTSGEQVKCVFRPSSLALPGNYKFKLELEGSASNNENSYSQPSPAIIVNPFFQMRIVNVSSNTIILGHNITITANLSIPTYNFCTPTCNSNNDKQELPGTPPYTYALRIISANNGQVVYTAFRTTLQPSFRFEIDSSKLGLGVYFANVIVSDDAQISAMSNLISSNFTVLNNPKTSEVRSMNFGENAISTSNLTVMPMLPKNMMALSLFNITANNRTASVINMTEKFPCGSTNVRPYILKNGTWKSINLFTINESACSITFSIPSDPIVSLMTNRTGTNLTQLNVTLIQNHTAQNETGAIVLIANVSDGSGHYVYNWYGNSGLINTTNSRILKLQSESVGTYEYYVIVNDMGYNMSGRSNIVIVTIPPQVQKNNSVSKTSVTGSTKINETAGLPNLTASGEISDHQQLWPLLGYVFALLLIIVIVLAILRIKKII